jgi:DNA-binding response OmpR family regulator
LTHHRLRHSFDNPNGIASGENATLASGFLEAGMEMITKPFAVETLANKVQEMLRAGTSDRAHAREFAAP